MKKNKIYVTTMYRWGSCESYSYVIYAGYSKDNAIKAGDDAYKYRGGKYSPMVVEFTPDKIETKKIVYDKTEYDDRL